jgi:hypothetical protein
MAGLRGDGAGADVVFVPERHDEHERRPGLQAVVQVVGVPVPRLFAVRLALGVLPPAYRVVDEDEVEARAGRRVAHAAGHDEPAAGGRPLVGRALVGGDEGALGRHVADAAAELPGEALIVAGHEDVVGRAALDPAKGKADRHRLALAVARRHVDGEAVDLAPLDGREVLVDEAHVLGHRPALRERPLEPGVVVLRPGRIRRHHGRTAPAKPERAGLHGGEHYGEAANHSGGDSGLRPARERASSRRTALSVITPCSTATASAFCRCSQDASANTSACTRSARRLAAR